MKLTPAQQQVLQKPLVSTMCSKCHLCHTLPQAQSKGQMIRCPLTYLTPTMIRLRACLGTGVSVGQDRCCSLCGTAGHTIADCVLVKFGSQMLIDNDDDDLDDPDEEKPVNPTPRRRSIYVAGTLPKRHEVAKAKFPLCWLLANGRATEDHLGSRTRQSLQMETTPVTALQAVVLCCTASRGLACAFSHFVDNSASLSGSPVRGPLRTLLGTVVTSMWGQLEPPGLEGSIGTGKCELFRLAGESLAVHNADIEGCARRVLGSTGFQPTTGRHPCTFKLVDNLKATPPYPDKYDAEVRYRAVEGEGGLVVTRTESCVIGSHKVSTTFVQLVYQLEGRADGSMRDALLSQLGSDADQRRPHHHPQCQTMGCPHKVDQYLSWSLLHGPATLVVSMQRCAWSVVSDRFELAVGNGNLRYVLVAVASTASTSATAAATSSAGSFQCTFVTWSTARDPSSNWDSVKGTLAASTPVFAVYTVNPEDRHNCTSLHSVRSQHPGDVLGGFSNFAQGVALSSVFAYRDDRRGLDTLHMDVTPEDMVQFDSNSAVLGLVRVGMSQTCTATPASYMQLLSRGVVLEPASLPWTSAASGSRAMTQDNLLNIVARLREVTALQVGGSCRVLPRLAVVGEEGFAVCSALQALVCLEDVVSVALGCAASPTYGDSVARSKHLTSILYSRLAVELGQAWGIQSLQWLDYVVDADIPRHEDVLRDIGNPVATA
jgi:hypothetical protein